MISIASVKLIEYLTSAVNAVSSNPYVGSSLRTKIFLFLLSTYTDELISAPKILTFLPQPPSNYEYCESASSPVL